MRSVKNVFLERCSQNSQEKTCVRDSILIKLHSSGCKKKLRHKCFPVNLAKFLRTPFLQNTSGRLLLLSAFQKQLPEVFYEKRCSWKFRKIHKKHLRFAKFPKTPFLQNTPDVCFWLFRATLLKWGTATNLRSIVQVYHFFLGSINVQCMFSLVYTVYWHKQPSE